MGTQPHLQTPSEEKQRRMHKTGIQNALQDPSIDSTQFRISNPQICKDDSIVVQHFKSQWAKVSNTAIRENWIFQSALFR